MAKRLITMLAVLVALGFMVAGCGDDEGSSDTAVDTVTNTVTNDTVTEDETATDDTVTDDGAGTETDDENETGETSEGGGAAAPTTENQKKAIAQCMRNASAAPGLSAEARDKLEDLCEESASGDAQGLREAAAGICKTIAEDTFEEGDPKRARAVKSCEQGGD